MSAHRSTGRRVARIVLAVVSALVLVATVVGAGVSVVMGQLQGNITAIDVTEQIGPVESKPIAAVNEETGTFEPLNILLMGSDTREGKGNGGFGNATDIGGERSDTTILMHISGDRKSAIGVKNHVNTHEVCRLRIDHWYRSCAHRWMPESIQSGTSRDMNNAATANAANTPSPTARCVRRARTTSSDSCVGSASTDTAIRGPLWR